MIARAYQTSHPWISFRVNFDRASPQLWALLGQAVAFCEQVSGAVLPPFAAQQLDTMYLVKGARATTAIENNTLTEEQVRQALEGTLDLPPSRAYLGQEVSNILDACADIRDRLKGGNAPRLTPEWIAEANRTVLGGLEEQLPEGVVPGEPTTFPVTVGRYRAAPREDCPYLLDRLCRWLDEDDVPGPGTELLGPESGDAASAPGEAAEAPQAHSPFANRRRRRVAQGIVKATLAHLYIAWIHPFGDGNGRTARLVEFLLLARAGVPFPSAHLMSNHFNLTRNQYYRELDRSSRVDGGRGDVHGFAEYALRGLVDGLAEQCKYVESVQMGLAWEHYVFHTFRGVNQSQANRRRREVVLALSNQDGPVSKGDVPKLAPHVSDLYADKTYKTLTRDLNWLVAQGLIERGPGGYRAMTKLMKAFRTGKD